MGQFELDSKSRPGILIMRFEGAFSVDELRAWRVAVDEALASMGAADHHVFVDLRKLLPLSPEAAAFLQTCKEAAAAKPNFLGSAVLVASPLVAMQHRRTSVAGGVMDTELISSDEEACWEHLRRARRRPR